MSMPVARGSDLEGPAGYTYAAVAVRVANRPDAGEQVLDTLRGIRFSGWLAPPEDGWAVAVPASGTGTVAAGRRGVVGVGEALAGTALVLRVLDDRQLVVVAWQSGEEVGRYVSDPSAEPGAGADVLPDPVGVEHAEAIAAACGRAGAAEELEALLAEPLDPDDEIESERLGRALRLLGLPTWLATVWRVPRAMPYGPRPRDFIRLGAGRLGLLGRGLGRAAAVGRRRRRPPAVLLDPPRADGTDELGLWPV